MQIHITRPLARLAAVASVAGLAFAQQPDIAIMASAALNPTHCDFTDVRAKLLASGRFASVGFIECINATPSLADVMAYDAVLTWSNSNFQDAQTLGDVMADYVDAGGGVVVAVFANTSSSSHRALGGRWRSGGYDVIEPALGQQSDAATLGATLQPGHPLMAGVASLSAAIAFRPHVTTGLVQGSVVAEWADGSILVAEGTMPGRVDLGLYPPSSDCVPNNWDSATDGGALLANALAQVARQAAPVGTNYCSSTVNSTGSGAAISASGSSAVADGDVVLRAVGLPAQSFAFFLTSDTQGSVANPGGSQGTLCLGGSIGRFVGPGQIQNSGTMGEIELALDLAAHPTPTGLVAVQAGETWNFQAWYRDSIGGSATSNLTDGLTIAFN